MPSVAPGTVLPARADATTLGSAVPGFPHAEGPFAEAYASPRYAWSVVILLLIAYTVALLDRQIMSLMVEPIRRDLAITDTQISTLIGFSFVLFYGTAGLVLGRLVDRINRRNMIVIGVLVWCLATVACGLARSYWELFAARTMVGFGEAALSPAAYSMIADYFPPKDRPRANGVYSMGVFLGTGVAMILGGATIAAASAWVAQALPMLHHLSPWQLSFIIVGMPGLVLAAVMMTIREPSRKDAGTSATLPQGLGAFVSGQKFMLFALLIGFGLNALLNYCVISWSPSIFARKFGWTVLQSGVAIGVVLLTAGPLGVVFGGWWASRKMKGSPLEALLTTGRTSIALTIPLLILFGMAQSATLAFAALTLATFVIGIPASLAPAAFFEVTPNQFRGQIIAFYLFAASMLGLGVGVTAVAAFNDYVLVDPRAIGTSMAFVTSIAATCGALCLQAALRKHRRSREREA